MHLLQIELDKPIYRGELHQFRGWVAEQAGLDQDLFHNHREGQANRYHYRYPLIQYQEKAGKALVLGIDAGAKALQTLIDPENMTFCRTLGITRRLEEHFQPAMCEKPRRYAIQQWMALNADNYRRWDAMRDLPDLQKAELERVLAAHLLSFSAAISFDVPRPRGLWVSIEQVDAPRQVRYHGAKLLSFDIIFQANMELPRSVGIGKGASHGFGLLLPAAVRERRRRSVADLHVETAH